MVSIAKLFSINEIGPILGPPFRNSIGNTHRFSFQIRRPPISSNEKVKTSESIQKRLTPKPKLVDLGFKRIHQFLHPANLS